MKSTQEQRNIKAFLKDHDIRFSNISLNEIFILKGHFSHNEEITYQLIVLCFKNKFSIEFDQHVFYISQSSYK